MTPHMLVTFGSGANAYCVQEFKSGWPKAERLYKKLKAERKGLYSKNEDGYWELVLYDDERSWPSPTLH